MVYVIWLTYILMYSKQRFFYTWSYVARVILIASGVNDRFIRTQCHLLTGNWTIHLVPVYSDHQKNYILHFTTTKHMFTWFYYHLSSEKGITKVPVYSDHQKNYIVPQLSICLSVILLSSVLRKRYYKSTCI